MTDDTTIRMADSLPANLPTGTEQMVETKYRAWLKRRGFADNSHLSSGFRRVANARAKRASVNPH